MEAIKIKIEVNNRVAKNLTPEVFIVCRNSGYFVEFQFDKEWENVELKTALFAYNNQVVPVPFMGNVCEVPILDNTTLVGIGVKTSDYGLYTTTPAYANCKISFNTNTPTPTREVYDEIVSLINRALEITIREEKDPTVPEWAKQPEKPIYTYAEIQDKPELLQLGETEGTAYAGNKGKQNAENIILLQNTIDKELGASLAISINSANYVLTAELKAKNGNVLSTQAVDLPLEEMVVNAYQNKDGDLVLVLKNGKESTIELGALIKGLVSQKDFDDLVNSKGQPNGIPTLNSEGKVPSAQLPPLDYLPITGGAVNGSVTANEFLINDADEVTAYQAHSIQEGLNTYQFRGKSGTLALLSDLEPIETTANLAMQILYQSSIVYNPTTKDTYNERITAEGENVVDGSEAVLQKVVGSTVRCENLIPYPYEYGTRTINGITFTVNDDGSITINGTATSSAVFVLSRNLELKTETQYTINGGKDGIIVLARTNPNDAKWIESGNGKFETGTLLEGNTINYIGMYVVEGVTINNVTVYPMLNKGDTALPYQPYFTGLKSASFAGIESRGRNLIQYPYASTTKEVNGITFTDNGDGTITINGTATANFAYDISTRAITKINIPKAGTYYLSGSIDGGSISTYYLALQVLNGTTYIAGTTVYDKQGRAFSVSEEALNSHDNVILYFYIMQGQTFNNAILKPMLCHGSTALPYTPYIEPTVFNFPKTELNGVKIRINSKISDYINFENKKIVKNIEFISFTGEEQFNDYTPSYVYIFSNKDKYAYSENSTIAFLSSEPNIKAQQANIDGQGIQFKTPYATMDEFIAKLKELNQAGNPLTVAYPLKTPTEKDFTEEQKVAGKKYLVQAFGTESVRENDGKEYGADNTLTQDYIAIKE